MSTRPPLFLPLRAEYFQAFRDGAKTVEYRLYGPRWNEKTCAVGRPVMVSNGYQVRGRLEGTVTAFWKTSAVPDEWIAVYGPPNGRHAACIQIELKR